MKKQIALVLAGTAASIAGGLRLVQELVDRGDGGHTGAASSSSAAPAPTTSPAPKEERPANGDPVSEPTGSTETERTAAAAAPADASKSELYEIATELKVSGRSKMSKAELIEAINRAG